MHSMATKLERVKLDEISGVDEPANLVPGWLMIKSAEGLDGVLAEVSQVHSDLSAALEKAGILFEDAPDEVKSAASELSNYVRDLDADDSPAVEKTKVKLADRIRAILQKRKDEIEMTKEELQETLTESNADLAKTLGESITAALASGLAEIAKSVTAAPAAEEPAAEAEAADEKDEKIAELLTKVEAISGDLEATREALVGAIERTENIEKRVAISSRGSVAGQEGGEDEGEPTLKSAFGAALAGHAVQLS